mmetsp:Transcript_34232/g.96205  ORF Transcript_34232/g.96205 Transcript_34232/m.96205 type:complete len:396 (+) Transcript_34232:207-1394(+)
MALLPAPPWRRSRRPRASLSLASAAARSHLSTNLQFRCPPALAYPPQVLCPLLSFQPPQEPLPSHTLPLRCLQLLVDRWARWAWCSALALSRHREPLRSPLLQRPPSPAHPPGVLCSVPTSLPPQEPCPLPPMPARPPRVLCPVLTPLPPQEPLLQGRACLFPPLRPALVLLLHLPVDRWVVYSVLVLLPPQEPLPGLYEQFLQLPVGLLRAVCPVFAPLPLQEPPDTLLVLRLQCPADPRGVVYSMLTALPTQEPPPLLLHLLVGPPRLVRSRLTLLPPQGARLRPTLRAPRLLLRQVLVDPRSAVCPGLAWLLLRVPPRSLLSPRRPLPAYLPGVGTSLLASRRPPQTPLSLCPPPLLARRPAAVSSVLASPCPPPHPLDPFPRFASHRLNAP